MESDALTGIVEAHGEFIVVIDVRVRGGFAGVAESIDESVRKLRAQKTDNEYIEAKASAGGLPSDTWPTISAFANSIVGGRVIFGLNESAGFAVIQDLKAKSIVDKIVTGLTDNNLANRKVDPIPPYKIQTVEFEGHRLVVLDVFPLTPLTNPQSPGPCIVVSKGPGKGAFKRVADQNQIMSMQESYAIHSKWVPQDFDQEPVEGMTLEDLDPELIQALLRRVEKRGSRIAQHADDDLTKLQRLRVATRDGQITLAGGLTLGRYPQEFGQQFSIDLAVHPQETKMTVGPIRFLDRRVLDGPIPYMVQDALYGVLANLKSIRIVKGLQGTDESEVPEDVLREVITNAVMHRDYGPHYSGQRISIDIFPDRLEIMSPGGLPGDMTVENLAEGRSIARNKILANLLRQTPIPGDDGVIAESQGTGVQRIIAGMTRRGLPEPQYDVRLTSVTVTLYRHGVITEEISSWLDRLPGSLRRSKQENIVLALLKRQGPLTVRQLRGTLSYDSDDIRNILGALLADELIEGFGDGPYGVSSNFLTAEPHVANGHHFTELEHTVIAALDIANKKTIRELAAELNRKADTLRPVLRGLVDAGVVIPTAPPQSRNRAYLRAPERP